MLDDLKYIHDKDAQDALGIAAKQPAQLLHSFAATKLLPKKKYNNIIYAGMGGSALAALLVASCPGFSVPFKVSRDYDIPAFVGTDTLFIACSYSGNTEETLSALEHAAAKKATIVIIAGGGKLQEIAELKQYPFIQLPKAEQPRYAVFYNFKAVLELLQSSYLLAEKFSPSVLKTAVAFLDKQAQLSIPTVPTAKNPAKKLAQELMGKSAVIYAGPFLTPAAYKWKISINENAKNVAWAGYLPEFNHNEFIGWSSHPHNKPYAVVDLRSSFDHPQVVKRFEISARLLSGKRPEPHIVQAAGDTKLQQLLWTVLFGDFTSIYLGLLNGLNPTPVELVEKLKKQLS